jgi:hypothetical protein
MNQSHNKQRSGLIVVLHSEKTHVILILLYLISIASQGQDQKDELFQQNNECIIKLFQENDNSNSRNKITKKADRDKVIITTDSINFRIQTVTRNNGMLITRSTHNNLTNIALNEEFDSNGLLKLKGFTVSNIKIGEWLAYENGDWAGGATIYDPSPFITFCKFFEIAKENKMTSGRFDISYTYDPSFWFIENYDRKERLEYDNAVFKFKIVKTKK